MFKHIIETIKLFIYGLSGRYELRQHSESYRLNSGISSNQEPYRQAIWW